MTHKTEVNFSIPKIDDLYCVNCKVNLIDFQDSIVKTLFHCQILTCRLIIYAVRCCIASPSIQNAEDMIHVIVSKKFFATKKLQKFLTDLKVKFTDPEPVHSKIYQACLKYTFSFKLAPTWNLVGKSFYVNGFNFLSLPSNANAIEWNILFRGEEETKLEIKPMKINLVPLTLELLSLPTSIVDNFTTNPYCKTNSINLTLFRCPWVYVLPRLTKARVVSVSKILPESTPFDNYNDLRRHWKNMYSYRLPKTEEGMLFYEVVFPLTPNQQFTYPEMCILSKMPEILMCEDKNKVTSQFIKDLTTSMNSICGEVIKVGCLFPELNIEHSKSSMKKRLTDYSGLDNQYQTSPFFKTPSDCKVIPTDEKKTLSSLFTFKAKNKLKIPEKNVTQNVLADKNQKPKDNCKCKKSDDDSGEDENYRNYMSNVYRCDVDTDNVNSYYDLPWMNLDEKTLKEIDDATEKELTDLTSSLLDNTVQDEVEHENSFDSLDNMAKGFNKKNKLLVKKVESVDLNLAAFKKFGTFYSVNQSALDSEKKKTEQTNEKGTREDLINKKHNIKYDTNKANKQNDSLQNKNCKLQRQKLQLGLDDAQVLQSNKLEDQNLDKILTSFDPYQSSNDNPNSKKNVCSTVPSQNISSKSNLNSSSKLLPHHLNSPKQNNSKQFSQDQNLRNENKNPQNFNLNENELHSEVLQNFTSLLDNNTIKSNSITKSDFASTSNQKIVEPISLTNKSNFDKEGNCNDLKSELLSNTNLKPIFDGDLFQNIQTKSYFKNNNEHNSNDHFSNSQSSSSTNFMLEGLIDRKSLQSDDSPEAIGNLQKLNNFEKFDSDAEYYQNNESQYSPSIIKKYQKKTDQSFVKCNQSIQNKNAYEDIFNKYSQNERLNQSNPSIKEASGLNNQDITKSNSYLIENDFTNLLSESSDDETDYGTYEEYKQACTESLTFY